MKIVTRLSVLHSILGIVALLCAQSAIGQQTSPEKPIISKMLVANVYPSGYSEIYPLDSLSGHRVVSTIDFSTLEPAVMIEAPGAIYDFFILCSRWSVEDVIQEQQSGNITAKGLPNHWPQQLPSRAGAARYLPITSTSASGTEAQGERHLLDLLHRHYQANRTDIEARARQREIDQERATAAEAVRLAALPPPEPLSAIRVAF